MASVSALLSLLKNDQYTIAATPIKEDGSSVFANLLEMIKNDTDIKSADETVSKLLNTPKSSKDLEKGPFKKDILFTLQHLIEQIKEIKTLPSSIDTKEDQSKLTEIFVKELISHINDIAFTKDPQITKKIIKDIKTLKIKVPKNILTCLEKKTDDKNIVNDKMEQKSFFAKAKLKKIISKSAILHEIRTADNLKTLVQKAQKFNIPLQSIHIDKDKREFIEDKSILLSDLKKRIIPMRKENAKTSIVGKEEKNYLQSFLTDNIKKSDNKKSKNTTDLLDEIKVLSKNHISTTKSQNSLQNSLVDALQPISKDNNSKIIHKMDNDSDVNLFQTQNVHKEKSVLKQKIVDAKATVRHFATKLQEQVQNYKPPMTRMNLKLNPKDLGNVDITLINRGNNLHIQVQSNTTAIGIMATQGGELKNQLISMGFTDVQMQFNMGQQQQHKQQFQSAKQYLKEDEIPDFYESLDLIIPHYV